MQREGAADSFARGGRDPFFGRSFFSTLFGGRDDPFFTRPFGALFGSNMFETTEPFDTVTPAAPSTNRPVIKELNSDGEEVEEEENNRDANEMKKSSDVVRRSDGQKADVEKEEREVKSQSFCYRKVTYGGVDGAYRTSTVSRRTASDGVVMEESKAADMTTGRAEHRISRGIQNKGHSVMRMLKPDGKVETMQTLHNLNEDELAGFEESWKGNASKHIGQWKENQEQKKHIFPEAGSGGWDSMRLNWDKKRSPIVAPSASDDRARTPSSNVGAKKVVRIPIQ